MSEIQVPRCQSRASPVSRPFSGQQSQACRVKCFLSSVAQSCQTLCNCIDARLPYPSPFLHNCKGLFLLCPYMRCFWKCWVYLEFLSWVGPPLACWAWDKRETRAAVGVLRKAVPLVELQRKTYNLAWRALGYPADSSVSSPTWV